MKVAARHLPGRWAAGACQRWQVEIDDCLIQNPAYSSAHDHIMKKTLKTPGFQCFFMMIFDSLILRLVLFHIQCFYQTDIAVLFGEILQGELVGKENNRPLEMVENKHGA